MHDCGTMTARGDELPSPLLVALCGPDGAGKTTLLAALRERARDTQLRFVGRGPATAERVVERWTPRTFHDHRDWLEGEFAGALALACAMDYCGFFENTLAPLLDGTSGDVAAVLCDRHALCFEAFALCAGQPQPAALAMLRQVRQPDLVIYVTASEAVRRARIEAGQVGPFDHPECQRRFEQAYARLLSAFGTAVVEVTNEGPIDSALAVIAEAVEQRVRARFHSGPAKAPLWSVA